MTRQVYALNEMATRSHWPRCRGSEDGLGEPIAMHSDVLASAHVTLDIMIRRAVGMAVNPKSAIAVSAIC